MSTSQTASCGSVARSRGSTSAWSSVSTRRSALAVMMALSSATEAPVAVGHGESGGRAAHGSLDLGRDGSRLHHADRDGGRSQERAACDQHSGQGFGHDRRRPATLRHSFSTHRLEAGVPLHTVSELLGHSSVAVTGDVYGHVSTRAPALLSSGSQQRWRGENVRRCYTCCYISASGYERGRPRSSRRRPLTCCWSQSG